MKKTVFILFLFTFLNGFTIHAQNNIVVGAERISEFLPLLKGKRIALVANQTSLVEGVHTVDTLLSLGINVKKVFAPEHGFRGTADAGEFVDDAKDKKTGLPLISLYGANKKPSKVSLKDIDVIVFDIQDVGVRYYTYISTMHYMMEACAENNKLFVVLDRPNPNGFYIDGPVLQKKYASFVGLHPIPLVHGLTTGELALMINGEAWLKNKVKCSLKVISCENYSHNDFYNLPVRPSPNLPNMLSVYLYPSLGLFEGTIVSVGRGTDKPFQVYGHPKMQNTPFSFTPKSVEGAKNPPYENQECRGFDISNMNEDELRNQKKLNLQFLLKAYKNSPDSADFFLPNNFFNLLSGNAELMRQVKEGREEAEIRRSWAAELEQYKSMRKKYLLYYDFE